MINLQQLKARFQGLSFTEQSAPFAFLVICILGFGLLIPSLGYYMDDWPYVFYAFNKGIPSLREMLIYDSRPMAAWLYMLGFQVLGFRPIAWHIVSLLMRWLTVVLMWLIIRSVWPKRKKEAIYISLLFAVYPFFMLQPFAVGSTHHWFGFLTFNLSLLLMIYAVQNGGKFKWSIITLAALLDVIQLFTSEYFAGLELIRPVILWILIARIEPRFSKRISQVLASWLPFALMLGVFAYWRTVIYMPPPDVMRNTPVILHQLFKQPFNAIGFLIISSIKDAYSVLSLGWQMATDVNLLDVSTAFPQFRIVVSILSLGLIYFYLSKLMPHPTEIKDDWKAGSTILAIVAILVGGLPVWLIGRTIVESKNLLSASRFGIPAMFGAALVVFLLMDYMVTDGRKKLLLLSLVLALAIDFHLDNTKQFQYSWEKQIRFSQQLLWRAPAIRPGTALLTDQEILGVMGDYAVAFSINTSYQPRHMDHALPYWYFPFLYTNPNVSDLLQGVPLEDAKLSMTFTGNSKQILLLDFNPELNRCLWVMQPQDTNLRLVSADMRQLSAGSDISLIQPSGSSTLPVEIYGKQSNDSWCYYFEKADLARQYGQWDEVVRLWNESQAKGKHADNGFEYIPFIEGFGHVENWDQVKLLTRSANRITAGLEPSLCSAMDRLAATAPPSSTSEGTLKGLKEDLKCTNYQ